MLGIIEASKFGMVGIRVEILHGIPSSKVVSNLKECTTFLNFNLAGIFYGIVYCI